MAEEGADLVGCLGGEDVLELAGLLLDLGLAVHGEAVGEEALGEAVTADDAAGALASAWSQFDDQRAVSGRHCYRLQRLVAGIHKRLVIVRFGWMGAETTNPISIIFSIARLTGSAPCTSMRSTSAISPFSASTQSSSRTSSNCSSSAIEKISCEAILP